MLPESATGACPSATSRPLEACLDGQFNGEKSLRIDVDIAVDRRVSVTDLSMCKDAQPGVHICASPTTAEAACINPHAKALRLPPLKAGTSARAAGTIAVKRKSLRVSGAR